MTAKNPGMNTTWVDPDDAPEWTDGMFASADHFDGARLVRRGRPKLAAPKIPVSIRLSADIVDRLKATGAGWQTKVDAALAEWLVRNGL